MADIYKTSIEAGREARSRGQTGEAPDRDASLGVMADGIRTGMGIRGGVSEPVAPVTSTRTAIAPPVETQASAPVDILAQISARPTRDPAEMEAEDTLAATPKEPGIVDSAAKGLKSVMVTWDFLANKLETAVTGDGSTTAPILQQGVEEYKAMASDPRIAEMIKLGNDAPGYYDAGKAMLSYAARNPGLIANFLAEQGAAVVASLPLGGVGGRVAGAAVNRTALSQGVKSAVTMGATGASINSSAVVLGSLGTNYVEGLDKFKGDKNAAADYASTKTLAEVPANAVAGMFLGVNPFTRLAAGSPTAAAVGNVGFQTAVQGAGGGVGAVQAAQSVGEEAGKGEVLAEIFGEGILAPIDLASARRDAKQAGLTPPGASVTVEQAPKEFDNAAPIQQGEVFQDQDPSRLSPAEYKSAIESPAFMAVMYSRADEATRARLQAANPNLNLAELVQDGNLVMDGMKFTDNGTGPELVAMFNQALAQSNPAPQTTTAAPFDGATQVGNPPEDFVPPREKMRLARNLAEEGQMLAEGTTITKAAADAIKASKAAAAQAPVDAVVEDKVEAKPSAPTGEENTPVASQRSPLAQLTKVEASINQDTGNATALSETPSNEPAAESKATATIKSPDLGKIRDAKTRREYEMGILDVANQVSDGSKIYDPDTDETYTVRKRTTNRGMEIVEFDAGRNSFQFEKKPDADWTVSGDAVFPTNPQFELSETPSVATQTAKDSSAAQAQPQPRFGLPSTISVDDKVYVVEIGKTNKKRADDSPVHAFVSHKGKVIKIDAQSIVDQFDKDPWTKPKVEGVTALPEDTFTSAEQWLDFVFKHEVGHIGNRKRPGETVGAYENRINEIALVQVKGQDFADSVYKPAPAVQSEVTPAPAPENKPEVTNETPAPQVQETAPVAERTQGEPSNQEPQERTVQAVVPQASQARQAPAKTVVSDEVPPLVGPTRDRLYFEGAEKQELTEKILEKYPYKMQQKMIARIRNMPIEGVRKLWSKVSNLETIKPPRREQEANQFDDDTGGVMSNIARSGAMGLDAIAELGNKERAEAARRAQLEEEVRQSTRAMNRRAAAAAETITDPELRALADSQQREIGGTTVDGFINPEGEFTSIEEVTQAELDATTAEAESQDVAAQLAEAFFVGELTMVEVKQRARAEGVGNFNLINAMRTYGVDPTPSEIRESGAIAANYTLPSYIRESGFSEYQARELWLKSYDNLTDKTAVPLTKTEQAAYDNWKSQRVKYKARLSEAVKENAQYQAGTLEDVFPNVLFTQFNLSEMRNPSSIPEPLRAVVTDLFEDPANAWFQDIATVLTIRPDFEAQVDAVLTKDEQSAYTEWRNSNLREALRKSEMLAKSPAYSQLSQLRSLSPEMYAEYQGKIAAAEQRQLAQILHEAAEMNDRADAAIKAGVAPENTIDSQIRDYMLRDEQIAKSPDEMTDEDGTALYRRGQFSGVVTALAIKESLTNKFAKWTNKPEYTVVQNANQLPMDVRVRLTSRFDNGSFKGAIDPKTGHIYLFSDFMENVADAEFTMFHELYGHWGMRAFLGSKMDSFLENQYKLNQKVRVAADRMRAAAASSDMPMSRLESIDEAISDLAADGDTSLFRQIIGRLTSWLRANGFDTVAKWMDRSGESELAYVLAGARRAARGQGISPMDGAPSEVRYAANNLPIELNATRDGKLTGYARINPITGYWTVFQINDLKEGDYTATTVEDYASVSEILKKVGTITKAKDRATRVDVDPTDFVDYPDSRDIVGWRRVARAAQIKAQNMYLPIFERAEYLKRMGVETTVIEDLKRYEGKTKYFVDNFENKFQVPISRLLKRLGDLGEDVASIDLFLLARHAEERNKVIKNINPKNTAGSGMSAKNRTLKDGTVVPGYIDVLNDVSNKGQADLFEELGKLTDEMSKDKVAYMLQTGLITQKQADALNDYEHYVNLSGNEKLELDKFDASVLGGRSFNLRGADAKRALGRGTLPVDVLQNTMNSYLATIIRGQKNTVVRSILDMLEKNPDPNFAVVEQVKEVKRLNTEKLLADKDILKVIGDSATEVSGKQFLESLAFQLSDGQIDATEAVEQLNQRIREAEARRDIEPAQAAAAIRRNNEEVVISGRLSPDGYISMVEDPTVQNADNVLVAKVDGKIVRMVFQEKGLDFVNAISGMSMQSRSDTLNAVGAWGRFFSQLVTSWNPAWVPVNGIRDFQTALTNMADDPRVGAKLAKEMAKAWPSAYRSAFRYQVADQANKKDGWWGNYLASRSEKHPISAADAGYYQEFRESGAETFFLDRKGLEETIETLNRHMNGPSGVLDWTKGKMEGVGSLMELMTLPMETAPRFAVYKTLRENGRSIEEAAVYAKELTVNFNMKGSSQWIRSLFVFANPSIQGTYRLFQNYSRGEVGVQKYLPSNRFAAAMGGWMMLGMLGNFLARGLGGEDDELPGVDKLDQIPHHKRSTSFIIAPDVPGMALPVGYGINVFFTLGHYLPDVWTGRADAGQVAGKVLKTAFDSFSPIGSGADSKTMAGTVIKTVTPSIAVPLVELGMNENRFGAPIFKQQSPFSDVKESNAYMHFDSVNPLSRSLMRSLSDATGGTRYKPGLIDVNPAAVDALIGSYLPGLINEAYKGAGLAVRVARGEDTKRAPIPLVDRLTARVPESWDAGAIRRAKTVVDTAYKELTSVDTTKERRAEIRAQYPGIGAAKAVLAGTDQQIKQIRQQLEAYERDPRKSDDQKVAFRNKMKEAEKKIQNRAVQATLKAGFKNELINEAN